MTISLQWTSKYSPVTTSCSERQKEKDRRKVFWFRERVMQRETWRADLGTRKNNSSTNLLNPKITRIIGKEDMLSHLTILLIKINKWASNTKRLELSSNLETRRKKKHLPKKPPQLELNHGRYSLVKSYRKRKISPFWSPKCGILPKSIVSHGEAASIGSWAVSPSNMGLSNPFYQRQPDPNQTKSFMIKAVNILGRY